ncbi:hypothetical protein GCM10007175_21440 [Pseudarthrobacter scleromae]|uniref:Secreted protein n=1 Tax=Pseudarthrobacter scleromae TaxID=158897 RepID=A0ABQ2CH90_9MICC|nr:hypothetical protein GCM10007175_21440 [Pseudarthrobacter scleromae]
MTSPILSSQMGIRCGRFMAMIVLAVVAPMPQRFVLRAAVDSREQGGGTLVRAQGCCFGAAEAAQWHVGGDLLR